MKKFLVFIFAELLFNSTFGQTYHPLIRTKVFWDIQFCGISPGFCDFDGGGRYFFNGDTVIAGHNYKVVWSNPIYSIYYPSVYCPPYAIDTNLKIQTNIYMREDTMARKVFIYDKNNSTEDLMYDFNLVSGDTLNSFYAGAGSMLSIDSVRITTILNGDSRKIFYLNNGQFYIESIGGSRGLFTPMILYAEGCSIPQCTTFDTTHVWGNSCYQILPVGVEAYETDKAIEIFPNPAYTYIQINQPENISRTFSIYDLTGRIVLNRHLVNSTEIIDISNLTGGTYIYKLDSENNRTRNGKIIILR